MSAPGPVEAVALRARRLADFFPMTMRLLGGRVNGPRRLVAARSLDVSVSGHGHVGPDRDRPLALRDAPGPADPADDVQPAAAAAEQGGDAGLRAGDCT